MSADSRNANRQQKYSKKCNYFEFGSIIRPMGNYRQLNTPAKFNTIALSKANSGKYGATAT